MQTYICCIKTKILDVVFKLLDVITGFVTVITSFFVQLTCVTKNKCLTLNFRKMKNLENFGVQELNAREVRETEGGIIPLLLYGAALVIEVGCYALAGDIIINFNSYAEELESYCN